MGSVIIYTADGCKFCEDAKEALKARGLSYEERNVDNNPQYLKEAHELGKRWLPIIRAGETVLVSPTADELNRMLDDSYGCR